VWEILEEIVGLVCGINIFLSDMYMSTLDDYCLGESKYKNPVLDKIEERYKISRMYLDSMYGDPIALLALYIGINQGETGKK